MFSNHGRRSNSCSYIPFLLLPLPLSLSPIHLTILLTMTYILNRPCLYCSLLLIILFASSCYWSGNCIVDFSYVPFEEGGSAQATWWLPQIYTMNEKRCSQAVKNETVAYLTSSLANRTASSIVHVAGRIREKVISQNVTAGHLSSMYSSTKELFRKEWTIPCIGTRVVL